ncbi:hypothetical protein J8L98_15200 [Pseudoalteromonas sp. MMG013]|uniref:Co-chaperone DjlA N-terminal domain-containing protein n=1 Tax=Pseudoalteromonas aurantia 208 TaxID=1314867 RepID=A0ABR9E9E3_9GAMM|nr:MULTISPECIES: hypothetical protein [Pseudoalteromonas]MBE0367600.1 hypothetical protein [Pseudoalteromonas aurantia 208]MBQ4845960.1 hypothetical protein [Pseudoalteromonas sp. MMG005]MBQ4863032.1 hypothetical protein [Pseudoalteromonas sp. MMG013]
MKFEQLLSHFDSGICVEQLQKESLLDLALLFVGVDGVISDTELAVVRKWAETLSWNSSVKLDNYIVDMTGKCILAVKNDDIEAFIQHRMKHIVDKPMRELAVKLAHKVIAADGKIDSNELAAMSLLEEQV